MTIELKITLSQIQFLAEAKVFERGKNYFEDGSIQHRVLRGQRIEAFCEGSQYAPYHVTAILNGEGYVSSTCTCPYDWGGICKHVVALLLTYLLEAKSFTIRATISELLAQKSHDELVNMIEAMLNHHPDLLNLVDPDNNAPSPFISGDHFDQDYY